MADEKRNVGSSRRAKYLNRTPFTFRLTQAEYNAIKPLVMALREQTEHRSTLPQTLDI